MNIDEQDDDLRARFRALAAEEEASAPELSFGHISAWRTALRIQRRRTMRVGTVIGMAAGVVATLAIGLVLGARTGYASADVIVKERGDTPLPPAPALAVLKHIPPLMFACNDPVRVAAVPPAPQQQGVPIVDLPAASAKSTEWFRSILGLRQLPNGTVLVNDAGRRSLKLLDSSLALQSIVRDSEPGSANSYGQRPSPFVRYLGDSSLMVDANAGTLLILGPTGQVAHPMAPLSPDMLQGLSISFGGVDEKGRIITEARMRPLIGAPSPAAFDSGLVVRSDLDARRADTLARVKSISSTHMMGRADGSPAIRYSVEPAPVLDQWALLADGSIAIVRGQDYHIDWIHADGATHSTTKLPFDWKRLTDEDKQRLIDSTRDATAPSLARALGQAPAKAAAIADGSGGGAGEKPGGRGYNPAGPDPNAVPAAVQYIPPALKDMPDYSPPMRRGALIADLDGNLWILPTSSAQSKAGELVYDVTNVKGDFHRVRVPLGRSIAGFGKGGVVYLISGDRTNGFYLEKTRLPAARK